MVATNYKTTLEYIPICLKPKPKEPALMMVCPPPALGCIPSLLMSMLQLSLLPVQTLGPRRPQWSKQPTREGSGMGSRVGKASQSQQHLWTQGENSETLGLLQGVRGGRSPVMVGLVFQAPPGESCRAVMSGTS